MLIQTESSFPMSVRICVLGSGSAGNCTLVATERTRVLVDAGFSFREIRLRLQKIGEDFERLDAVLITHEHSDHVAGLPALGRKLRKPIFITRLTESRLDWGEERSGSEGSWPPQAPLATAHGSGAPDLSRDREGAVARSKTGPRTKQDTVRPQIEFFQAGQRISIGDFEIDSFTVPHDAADPVAFCFRAEGLKLGVVTDLGYMPESVKQQIRGCHFLALESNHDLDMLKVGPYPWFVKQRVMSRVGHLSNHAVSEFLTADYDRASQVLVLAHLSEQNNHPEIARLTAVDALSSAGAGSTRLVLAEQRRPTEVFEF